MSDLYPLQSMSSTPTPTPTPSITMTPVPTNTPTATVTPTPTLPRRTRNTHLVYAFTQYDRSSNQINLGVLRDVLLTDQDTGSPIADDMTLLGLSSNARSWTSDAGFTQNRVLCLIDKKPKNDNSRYLNGNLYVVGDYTEIVDESVGVEYTLPGKIVPFGDSDRSTNLNLPPTGQEYKCNISIKSIASRARKNEYNNRLEHNYTYVPRLKSGVAILDRLGTYLPEWNQDFNNPTEISVLAENYIFGDYLSAARKSAVSTAYHPRSDMLIVATIDDLGNGEIIFFDAKTTQLHELYKISFPVDGNGLSSVDIIFEVYIKSQYSHEDKLFVNMAGNNGTKNIKIYDLSNILDAVTPIPSPTPTPTPSDTPSRTPAPTRTPTSTPATTPTPTTTPVAPSTTPTKTPTVTPSPSFEIKYRYTRDTIALENLIPCRKYELILEIDPIQDGNASIQILDFDDINRTQFDNIITFESQNIQKYYRLNDKTTPIASDEKAYQEIVYTIYHQTTLDKAVISFSLKDLETGEITKETRVVKCGNKIECDKPRVDCVDHNIKCIEQNPDGSFFLYVALDPVPNSNIEDYYYYVRDNKCCFVQESINDGEWKESNVLSCVNSIPLPPTPTPSITPTNTPTSSSTPSPSATPTLTLSLTPFPTITPSPTKTPTPTTSPPVLPPITDCEGVICVALIDENSGSASRNTFENQFRLFRSAFSKRLLFVMDVSWTENNGNGQMVYPSNFLSDSRAFSYYKKTGRYIPRGGSSSSVDVYQLMLDLVNDTGDQQIIDDFLNATELSLFVDDSGSMRESQVIATKNLLIETIESKGMTLRENVVNKDENVICPFITTSCCGWHPDAETLAGLCGVRECDPKPSNTPTMTPTPTQTPAFYRPPKPPCNPDRLPFIPRGITNDGTPGPSRFAVYNAPANGTAVLRWDGSNTISTYVVEYRPDGDDSWYLVTADCISYDTRTKRAFIKGLDSSTSYDFAIAYLNSPIEISDFSIYHNFNPSTSATEPCIKKPYDLLPGNIIVSTELVGSQYYYIFNGKSSREYYYLVQEGDYVFVNNNPHPIAFLNQGKPIGYIGDLVGTKRASDGNMYNFYNGNVAVNISGDFGIVSFECFYHGYMGGEQGLRFYCSEERQPLPPASPPLLLVDNFKRPDDNE